MQKEEAQAIEVEVVEIDGITPPPPSAAAPGVKDVSTQGAPWSDWQKWPGQVRQLDTRWWPLWIVLGIIALGLVLTVGVVLGAIYLVARLLRGMLLAFLAIFTPRSTSLR